MVHHSAAGPIHQRRATAFGFAVAAHPRDPLTAWFVPAEKDMRRIPVVFITGSAGTDTAIEAMKFGAYDYVLKPFDVPALIVGPCVAAPLAGQLQKLAVQKGARLRVIPVDDSGQILLDEFAKLLNPRTRLVAVTHVSNALGTVTPVADNYQKSVAGLFL